MTIAVRFEAGGQTFDYCEAQDGLALAQLARLNAVVSLFQALGGGWWHRADLAEDNDEK